MKTRIALIVVLLSIAGQAFAHRLDKYLQAVIVSVEPHQLRASFEFSTILTAYCSMNRSSN